MQTKGDEIQSLGFFMENWLLLVWMGDILYHSRAFVEKYSNLNTSTPNPSSAKMCSELKVVHLISPGEFLTKVAVVIASLCLSSLNLPSNRQQEVGRIVGLYDLFSCGWNQLTYGMDRYQASKMSRPCGVPHNCELTLPIKATWSSKNNSAILWNTYTTAA